jgi:hemolysin III
VHPGERFNAISHLIGAVLAAVGLIVLLVPAVRLGDPWRIVSFSVYGGCLFLLYLTSTLYHAFRGRAKRVLQMFDHAAIHLLIAGTYTPFTLLVLDGVWRWSIFGAVWGLAAVGMVTAFLPGRGWRVLAHVLYPVMGWLAVVGIRPLIASLEPAGLAWLFAGGVVYTLGIVAYAWKSLPWQHEIWHLFVLAGSISHFIALYGYVL